MNDGKPGVNAHLVLLMAKVSLDVLEHLLSRLAGFLTSLELQELVGDEVLQQDGVVAWNG